MNKNFQEMFAKAKQEKRGSLIGFATGMDPNYKTSKKILKEMAKHCGAVEVGIPFNTSTSDSSTIMNANMRAIKAGANTEKIFKLIKEVKSEIKKGLLVLLGIEDADTQEDIAWLCRKIVGLRIFNDAEGVMNLSIKDVDGDAIVVSQFTLHASTKKGNRPSYLKAAKPEVSIPLYEAFVNQLENELGKKVGTGEFGADMKVSLLNDGPVTIIIDSKNRI